MARLLTVGYGGHGIESFMAALQENDVDVVADIRYKAYTRREDFSKSSLPKHLKKISVAYIHMEELGNKNYNGKLGSGIMLADESEGLSKLSHLLSDVGNVAIMCACKDWRECHRKLVADRIKEFDYSGKIEIEHIEKKKGTTQLTLF